MHRAEMILVRPLYVLYPKLAQLLSSLPPCMSRGVSPSLLSALLLTPYLCLECGHPASLDCMEGRTTGQPTKKCYVEDTTPWFYADWISNRFGQLCSPPFQIAYYFPAAQLAGTRKIWKRGSSRPQLIH